MAFKLPATRAELALSRFERCIACHRPAGAYVIPRWWECQSCGSWQDEPAPSPAPAAVAPPSETEPDPDGNPGG
jgi:hypothetical protein